MRSLIVMFAVASMMVAGEAGASTATGAHITEIVPNNVGIVRVYLDVQRTGLPVCAGGTNTQFDINGATIAGQVLVSALYMAMAANLPVDFGGTGACDVETGIESIGYAGVRR